MVKTSLFSLIVQLIKSQFHSWLLSKIKFIDLITLLIYTLRYLYHCIVTNTVLLDQSLKSSLKITLSERITNEFFSPCGKRIRYQRHVISIKWRKNDETKHLITYQLPFSRFWKTALHQLLHIYWTLFQEPFCFHPKLFWLPLLPDPL